MRCAVALLALLCASTAEGLAPASRPKIPLSRPPTVEADRSAVRATADGELLALAPEVKNWAVPLGAILAVVIICNVSPVPGEIWAGIAGNPILQKAGKKALGGGLSGMVAGVVQVLSLMWLRTTMNYQYRYGTSTKEAMKTLYEQGGIKRFYQGVSYALFQTPLARFGDTAANTGVLELLSMLAWSQGMPMAYQTAIASAAGSLWRICITPIDTLKTTLQVEGAKGYQQLMDKIACEGPTVLFQGALANAFANFVGSYPWFFTFNLVMARLPAAPEGALLLRLLRSAIAGVSASCVSDVVSNVVRVLKTTRQTSPTTIGYREAAKQIIDKEGVKGLFTRGLGTRLITNAIQATLFSVVWKFFEYRVNG